MSFERLTFSLYIFLFLFVTLHVPHALCQVDVTDQVLVEPPPDDTPQAPVIIKIKKTFLSKHLAALDVKGDVSLSVGAKLVATSNSGRACVVPVKASTQKYVFIDTNLCTFEGQLVAGQELKLIEGPESTATSGKNGKVSPYIGIWLGVGSWKTSSDSSTSFQYGLASDIQQEYFKALLDLEFGTDSPGTGTTSTSVSTISGSIAIGATYFFNIAGTAEQPQYRLAPFIGLAGLMENDIQKIGSVQANSDILSFGPDVGFVFTVPGTGASVTADYIFSTEASGKARAGTTDFNLAGVTFTQFRTLLCYKVNQLFSVFFLYRQNSYLGTIAGQTAGTARGIYGLGGAINF